MSLAGSVGRESRLALIVSGTTMGAGAGLGAGLEAQAVARKSAGAPASLRLRRQLSLDDTNYPRMYGVKDRKRSSARSRPTATNNSFTGSDTVAPVRAIRIGCMTSPSLT